MVNSGDSLEKREQKQFLANKGSLFNGLSDPDPSDLILQLHHNLAELQDLCGRFSFSLRELKQIMKVK